MDRLDQYRVFIQVAEMGSFIKAAQALGIPRASASAAVQQLEVALGARLLHRTTRQVRLTTDGMQLLERVREFLVTAENIDQMFRAEQRKMAGRLHVDVPSRIARRLIVPALPEFLRRYPRLHLVLGSTDRTIDLVQEGVDCAVRVGALPKSSLVARPLGRIALINCASPEYLREHGIPTHPDDLRQGHWSVGYAPRSTGAEEPWEYVCRGKTEQVAVPSQVVVDNAESYIASCLAGLGLIQIPRFDVQHLISRGAIAEVMPEFRAQAMPLSLIYPHRRQRSTRVSVFGEWIEGLMRPHLEP